MTQDKLAAALWRRILTVSWCSILLGLTVEAVLLGIAAGFGTLHGASPVLADAVQKVSWSFLVCVGIACGSVAARARPAAMGALGLFSAPLAFAVSRALHKSANQALSITAAAQSGPSPYLLAALKGLEYAFLGCAVGWIAKRSWGGLGAHLGSGALAGVVFGGTILALMVTQAEPSLPTVAVVTRGVNEVLFPVGCAFVLYVAESLGKRLQS